jgi:hypothetical protein
MYWDTFTVAGAFISIVLILCTFYLEFRKRPLTGSDQRRQA